MKIISTIKIKQIYMFERKNSDFEAKLRLQSRCFNPFKMLSGRCGTLFYFENLFLVFGIMRYEKITPASDTVVAKKKTPPTPSISIIVGKACR